MGMYMDGEVGVGLADSADKTIVGETTNKSKMSHLQLRSLWLEKAGHILNAQNMYTFSNERIHKIEVVL